MRESFSNFLIYLYCKRKASEIFIFHFFRRSKMRRGGCSLTHLTHFKATKRFQYTHFSSCHPSVVTKGFIKGKACRLLPTKTPLKQHLKLLFHKSHRTESIRKLSCQQLSQKLHFRRENLPYNRNVNKRRESCFLSRHTTSPISA